MTEVYQVERGEYAGFSLNSATLKKKLISEADTIGKIISSESQRRLTELQSRLTESEKNLDLFQSADKEKLVEIAANRVGVYQDQLQNQKKILTRKKELFNKQLLSEEEIDLELKNLKDIEQGLFEVRAEYEQLSSGAKPEQITYLKSIIEGIRNEINKVLEIQKKFDIFPPFGGRVIQTFSEDTLIIIADRQSSIFIPVPLKYLSEIKVGQTFKCRLPFAIKTVGEISGEIIGINNAIIQINQQDVAMVSGKINPQFLDLPLNMIVTGSLSISEVTIRAYIFNFVGSVFGAMY